MHSLAYAYYTNTYDRQIVSKCSPQVYDILTSKTSMNSPLLGSYKDKGEVAHDVNKQYTHIVMNCDEFGWPIYMPTDQVEDYDNIIEAGIYFYRNQLCVCIRR